MIRHEFFKKAWRPYPPAPPRSLDVAAIRARLRADPTDPSGESLIVAGRLGREEQGRWSLSSGGETIEFKFVPPLRCLDGSSKHGAKDSAPEVVDAFLARPEQVLVPGDLICLKIETSRCEAPLLRAREILVLAPYAAGTSAGDNAMAEFPANAAMSFSVARSRQWAWFLQAIRDFFRALDFVEVMTPTLVSSPGSEPFLDPFLTRWQGPDVAKTLYLPTSPEFHLKQMLVRGWSRIFELKTCFRNGESGDHHQPEFLMLEWYRAFADLDAIVDDVKCLFVYLSQRLRNEAAALGATAAEVAELRMTTMARLFADRFDGFRLRPTTSINELRDLAGKEGVAVAQTDGWDDLFFKIFLEKIERGLGFEAPLLIRGYPPSQAALARLDEEGFADRFEIYWQGLEIANAFHELNDPVENERRLRSDIEKKRSLGKPTIPVDENLVRALRCGLPPSGGIALGVDRLFMAFFGIRSIQETRAFPFTPT